MSLPRMSWHIGDYKRDTGHLRAAGHGAYFLLCMHYWATGGLPDDDKQLAAIACMTDREWKAHKSIIKAFFKDGWRHKRVEQELADAQAMYDRRAAAGRKGGNAKAKAQQSYSNATPPPEQPITLTDKEEGIGKRAREVHAAFLTAARIDADDPAFFGTQHHIEALISRGFTRETILAGTARAIAGKAKTPSWPYIAKCIETENDERSSPAKPEVRNASKTGSLTAASDRVRERIRALAGGPGLRDGASEDAVRAIPALGGERS